MKQFIVLGSAALLLGAVGSVPVAKAAEGAGEAVKDAAKATGDAVKEGAEATADAVKGAAVKTGEVLGLKNGPAKEASAADAARYERAEQAEHSMTGTIAAIDPDTGTVELKTPEGNLVLQFPPAAVVGRAVGDPMGVELAFVELPLDAGARAYDSPDVQKEKAAKAEGDHWVTGTVQNIDRSKGAFELRTGDATLQLHYPPEEIAILDNGDEIAVEIAIVPPATPL